MSDLSRSRGRMAWLRVCRGDLVQPLVGVRARVQGTLSTLRTASWCVLGPKERTVRHHQSTFKKAPSRSSYEDPPKCSLRAALTS